MKPPSTYRRLVNLRPSAAQREEALTDEAGASHQEAIADAARELLLWTTEFPERATPDMRAQLRHVIDRADGPLGKQARSTTWPLKLFVDEAGEVTARALERLLAAEFRSVTNVRLEPSGQPSVVRWSGDANGRVLGGELVMRCEVLEDGRLFAWIEVSVDRNTLKRIVRRSEQEASSTSGQRPR